MLNEGKLFELLCNSLVIKITKNNKDLINSLIRKGLPVTINNNNCLLNTPIIPLNCKSIHETLSPYALEQLSLSEQDVMYEVDSTNRQLLNSQNTYQNQVLLAEYQNQARGRREREWFSPLGTNIYLSIKFKAATPYFHFIPLLTAVSICNVLTKQGITGCKIKWPNDIYLNNKKLSGILVESKQSKDNKNICVVGIGLNVNMTIKNPIDQPWTSLALEEKKSFDRNKIVGLLLSELIHTYNHIDSFDFDEFIKLWERYDYLRGKSIIVTEDYSTYTANALDLASDGSLRIKIGNEIKNIYSADVSVKHRDIL